MTNINEPCPFCGAGDDMLEWTGKFGARSICCIACGAQGPSSRTIARAWAAWNERKEGRG